LRCLGVLALLASCRPTKFQTSSGALRFEVGRGDVVMSRVDFAAGFEGADVLAVEVRLINEGRASRPLTWSTLQAPFSAQNLPAEAPSGESLFLVSLSLAQAGRFEGVLRALPDGNENEAISLPLQATVKPPVPCTASKTCKQSFFNPNLGRCVESNQVNGLSCAGDSKCLVDPTCQSGECVGKTKTCDDGNACTVDVCQVETGCEFLPAPPCPGDGKCQVGVCNPASGCGLTNAEDGKRCGALLSCRQAQVCIEGSCVVRDPPDGYICAEETPCSAEGRCVNDVCVKPPGADKILTSTWSFDSLDRPLPDAGVPQLHDFVLEKNGLLSLSGFFQAPMELRANAFPSVTAPQGVSRRCILWNEKYVCADYPAATNGKVSQLNLETGAIDWTFDMRTARPDFLAQTTNLFLARLVVQAPDRLAALFEAYPRNSPMVVPQCRSYFLAVLDASGKLIRAQAIKDDIFNTCNHPHPYGVASDSVGNLYIAFSVTLSDQAPLVPGAPTLLISYSYDGIFRWKRTDITLKGGELAIAQGLLYPENSATAYFAPTGLPAVTIAGEFGRTVISKSRVIPAPKEDTNYFEGFEAGLSIARWRTLLDAQETFHSDHVRLAQWKTSKGLETVALTFTKRPANPNSSYWLTAFETETGFRAFSCAIELPQRTPPQLFEIQSETMAVMGGALEGDKRACSKCDPPHAGSSAQFDTYRLKNITAAPQPWIGTFGGANHDHHED
jgi:hypothetical protein